MNTLTELRQSYREAAERLAQARIRFAQAFLLAKARRDKPSDRTAEQIAIEQTKDEITVLAAELEIARRSLG